VSVRTTPSLPYSVLTTFGVFSCVPVTSTYSQPCATRRAAQSASDGASSSSSSTSARRRASTLFGVRQRRLRQQELAHRARHVGRRELVAAPGREHGIEDRAGSRDSRDDLGDRGDVLDAAEHAELERVDRHVLEQLARLVGHPVGVDRQHALDAERVLHGERGHDRQRMAAHARERQEVGLQSRAARRIGRGERQHDGRGSARSFGMDERGHAAERESAVGLLQFAILVHRDSAARVLAMKKYMCLICGWIYDEEQARPEEGIRRARAGRTCRRTGRVPNAARARKTSR
jgi:hypothetical protein